MKFWSVYALDQNQERRWQEYWSSTQQQREIEARLSKQGYRPKAKGKTLAKYTFDPKKDPPASGSRQDYIKPGPHRFKVLKYKEDETNAGKLMHVFDLQVVGGEEKGKKITDRFVMPKTSKDSRFPVQRLNAFIVAVAQPRLDKPITVDFSKFKGREFMAEVGDQRQEERVVDGKKYAARTVSAIAEYIDPRQQDAEDDDEDEDEEDEEDTDEDEEDEEDEDEEPVRAKRGKATATKSATRSASRNGASSKRGKAATATKAKKRASVEDDDDEDEDDLDDEDDEDEDEDDDD